LNAPTTARPPGLRLPQPRSTGRHRRSHPERSLRVYYLQPGPGRHPSVGRPGQRRWPRDGARLWGSHGRGARLPTRFRCPAKLWITIDHPSQVSCAGAQRTHAGAVIYPCARGHKRSGRHGHPPVHSVRRARTRSRKHAATPAGNTAVSPRVAGHSRTPLPRSQWACRPRRGQGQPDHARIEEGRSHAHRADQHLRHGQDQAGRFYTQVLGFEIKTKRPMARASAGSPWSLRTTRTVSSWRFTARMRRLKGTSDGRLRSPGDLGVAPRGAGGRALAC
jgi:hypothetical protein